MPHCEQQDRLSLSPTKSKVYVFQNKTEKMWHGGSLVGVIAARPEGQGFDFGLSVCILHDRPVSVCVLRVLRSTPAVQKHACDVNLEHLIDCRYVCECEWSIAFVCIWRD